MIHVGVVGTGYAAQRRVESLVADVRSHLVAVSGHARERVRELCDAHGAEAMTSGLELARRGDLDLVVISTVNREHGAIAQAALKSGKHVIVEYPLALDLQEAEKLVSLAHQSQRLLHVEHIELLSGVHQALLHGLAKIRQPFYVRSMSLRAERPAPDKWSYNPQLVGFPLMAALSRIQRLTRVFGAVSTVSCQSRFWLRSGEIVEHPNISDPYEACLCSAQLRFKTGLIADVVYGKGSAIGQTERRLDIHGEAGLVRLERSRGWLIQNDQQQELPVGSRRGLFAQDTQHVLEAIQALPRQLPLYVTAEQSLYALTVADAARRSALTQQSITL